MLSNHNPNVSLLPDNPSAQIMPVQGGGGSGSWHSTPITVENGTYQLALNHGFLKKFKTRWRQTLGPNIPSRRKPRQDPHIIVGSLNAHDNPVYLVAPLRGDSDAATRVFSWSDNLLTSEPDSHIVFMGPIVSAKENTSIESAMSALLSKYPGHIIFVSDKETTLPSLDGLLLEAVPHTSKQIALGFIPHHENVYNRSSRSLNKLIVETLRVPYSRKDKEETLGSLYYLNFQEPTTIKGRDRDNDDHDITKNMSFKVIPGWVTQITHGMKMSGGAPSIKESLVDKSVSKKVEEVKKLEEIKKKAEEAKDTKAEVKPKAELKPKDELKPLVTPQVKPEVTPEVKPVVTPEVKLEDTKDKVASELKPVVTPEVKPLVTSEVKPEDTKDELKPLVTPQVKPEVTPEVKPEDTKDELKPLVTPQVKPEVTPEVKPEDTKDELKPLVTPQVKPEVTPEVKPEVTPEVKLEDTKDKVAPEVKPVVTPEVKPEDTPEVKPEDTKDKVTPEVKPVVTPEVKSEDTPEVKPSEDAITPEVKPQAPAFTGATVTVTLDSDVYDIRNPSDPSVINDWSKGKFEGDELRLLDNEGLRYNNDIYSKFLQGLVNEQCSTEPDVQMRPECGIFRYIMANRYFNQVRFKNGRKPFSRGDTSYRTDSVVTPPVTSQASVTQEVTSKSVEPAKHVGFSNKSTVRTENKAGVHNSKVNTAKENGDTRGKVKKARGGTRSKRDSTVKLKFFY